MAMSRGEIERAKALGEKLQLAFYWADTPQGYDYWLNIRLALGNLPDGPQILNSKNALREYAEHREYCKTVMKAGMECQCGLAKLLAEQP